MTSDNKPKILVVDDTPANIYAISNILSSLDVTILTASSGNDALALLTEHEFAVILLDVQMGDVSGLDIAELLTMYGDNHYTPIIFITAMDRDEKVVAKGYEVGAVDYIVKPFDPFILKSKVQAFLKMYNQKASQNRCADGQAPESQAAVKPSRKQWLPVCALAVPLLLTFVYCVSLSKKNTQLLSSNKELKKVNTHTIKLNDAYKKFVPKDTLNLLDKESIADIHLGDQVKKEMAVLFVEIQGSSPQENMAEINELLQMMQKQIHKRHGIVHKYFGERLMALFHTGVDDAVRASLAILNDFSKYTQKKAGQEGACPRIGIGIDEGEMIVTTVGSESRMEQMIVSDAVDVAARISNLTRSYSALLLMSENTYKKIKDPSKYTIRLLDSVKVKANPVAVYQVLDAENEQAIELYRQTMNDFLQGICFYQEKKFSDAHLAFKKVLSTNQEDMAAKIYLKRCKNSLTLPQKAKGDEACEILDSRNSICSHSKIITTTSF